MLHWDAVFGQPGPRLFIAPSGIDGYGEPRHTGLLSERRYHTGVVRGRITVTNLCIAMWVLGVLVGSSIAPAPRAAEKKGDTAEMKPHVAIPTLDEMAGDWLEVANVANMPSVNNFHGGLHVNQDVLSVIWLTFPPYCHLDHTGELTIDGHKPQMAQCRWFPYQVLRKAQVEEVEIETAVRMVFEAQGVLFRIQLQNLGRETRQMNLKIDLLEPPLGRQIDHALVVGADGLPQSAQVAFAFADEPAQFQEGQASWTITLEPDQRDTIDYVMAVGDTKAAAIPEARQWAQEFDTVFQQAKDLWQDRFNDAFTPGNKHFSGNLPVLVTSDEKIRRMYYMSVLSVLACHRTNLPVSNRVYASGAPVHFCAETFFWSHWCWPTARALLDPQSMREELERWVKLDYINHFSEDFTTGKARGAPYQANSSSIFAVIDAYLRVTGDTALLDEEVQGKSVLQHMEHVATIWKRRAGYRDGKVSVNANVGLQGVSLTCWVKNQGQATSGRLWETIGADEQCMIYLTTQDEVGAATTSQDQDGARTTDEVLSTLTVPEDDEWHFVAVVDDLETITFYVDGASETVQSCGMNPTKMTGFWIGNNGSTISGYDQFKDLSSRILRAGLADWRLHNGPLSAEQVTAIRGGAKPKTNLVAAYSFDEGSGSILSDWSGNNHTGTVESLGKGVHWVQGRSGAALEFNARIPDRGPDLIADYGTRNECWPSYIYRVPSYNMPNVWMMRTVSDIYESRGKASRAEELRTDANRLAQAIVDEMYVPGEGCWLSIYPDGRKVEARNVQDLVYLPYILDDLTPLMRAEIMAFMDREMLAKHWVRGLSPRDPDADKPVAARPDFSQWGCFDGWIPLVTDSIFVLGYPDKALDFLRRTEVVTHEGPYSQARELFGPRRDEYDAPVRIAPWMSYNVVDGGSFADVIIRTFFGYSPEIEGDAMLSKPELSRGFEGKLLHLRHGDELHTITSHSEGISVNRE